MKWARELRNRGAGPSGPSQESSSAATCVLCFSQADVIGSFVCKVSKSHPLLNSCNMEWLASTSKNPANHLASSASVVHRPTACRSMLGKAMASAHQAIMRSLVHQCLHCLAGGLALGRIMLLISAYRRKSSVVSSRRREGRARFPLRYMSAAVLGRILSFACSRTSYRRWRGLKW